MKNLEEDKDVSAVEVEIDKVGLRLMGLNKDTRAKYNINKKISGVVISRLKEIQLQPKQD